MEKKEEKLKPDELGNDNKVRMWELRTSAALKKVLMDGVLVLDMEVAKAAAGKKEPLQAMKEECLDALWAEQVATGLLDHVELDDKDRSAGICVNAPTDVAQLFTRKTKSIGPVYSSALPT